MHFIKNVHLTNMKKLPILVLTLLVIACSKLQEPADTKQTETALQKVATPGQAVPPAVEELAPEPMVQPPITTNRQIVRNAELRFRVEDFTASGRAIEAAVRHFAGQIAHANETRSDNRIENNLTVRVPAARLDAFLALILKQSIFTETKTITAEDVTRRYVDVEARIRSKRTVEETYLRLLKQARSVADVLKVEEQLAKIREEREAQEAESRQLKDEVALSTVNLTYYEQTEAALRPEEPFYVRIGRNLTDGFGLLGDVLIGAFYFVPLGFIIAGVVWLISRWRRKRRNMV